MMVVFRPLRVYCTLIGFTFPFGKYFILFKLHFPNALLFFNIIGRNSPKNKISNITLFRLECYSSNIFIYLASGVEGGLVCMV